MKRLWLVGTIAGFLMMCVGLAGADSIQLRNGRHLQGKYIGGTEAVIGFMTGTAAEYFATSDVLAIIFDRNPDSPINGAQPMKKKLPAQVGHGNPRQASAGMKIRKKRPILKQVSAGASVSVAE